MTNKNLKIAKKIITEEIRKSGLILDRIILFGSRARDNFSKDSDWDFLIIVNEELDWKEKRKLSANIRMKLVYSGMPADIIIVSDKQFQERKKDVGHIVYYAIKEGLQV